LVAALKDLNNRISLIKLIVLMLLWLFVTSHSVSAFSFLEQFTDPQDGKFDASNWLINKKGFLPVPIIITEPAIGYGGGAALLFFHTKNAL
jgi:hypothetical protein